MLLNPKEHPNIKKGKINRKSIYNSKSFSFVGDIVEIFHPEDDDDEKNHRCRLLLQVSLAKDSQGRLDYISVESSIALTFNLKNYGDVFIQKVDIENVSLDSVEM